MVIFFNIFGQDIEHFDTIFELFDALRIIFINEVYLNLHEDFRILDIKSKKLTQQRVNSFKIIRRVSPLVYELKLPSNIKIYPIIFVTHLESASHGRDLYDRPRNDYLSLIEEGAVDPNSEW